MRPQKCLDRKIVDARAVAGNDQLVTLTKAHQQTNNPNTHTHSPTTCMTWFVIFCTALTLIGTWTNCGMSCCQYVIIIGFLTPLSSCNIIIVCALGMFFMALGWWDQLFEQKKVTSKVFGQVIGAFLVNSLGIPVVNFWADFGLNERVPVVKL